MTTSLSHAGDDPATAKQILRSRMRRARAAITRDAAAQAARQAAIHLLGLPELDGAAVVGLYAAFDGELDTQDADEGLRARGIAVAYPRVAPTERVLHFHVVHGPDELEPGPFGIPQPPAHAAAIDLTRIAVLVVPGLAFDDRGGRLGWGKGYYDATLAHAPLPLYVGYAHAVQLVAEVPRVSHDVAMDFVITDAGLIRASARANRLRSAPGARSEGADVEEPAT
jgi:5-formyltetrahydrofolate cyclo-ligase